MFPLHAGCLSRPDEAAELAADLDRPASLDVMVALRPGARAAAEIAAAILTDRRVSWPIRWWDGIFPLHRRSPVVAG
ncbi:hypothetical protein [Flindersiella endophytica]